jgi:hypothetical protein
MTARIGQDEKNTQNRLFLLAFSEIRVQDVAQRSIPYRELPHFSRPAASSTLSPRGEGEAP